MTAAGPKRAALLEPLPGERGFELWCPRWLRVPKGTDAGRPFRPRRWQLDLAEDLHAPDTLVAMLLCGRGNGKSGLAAALALHALLGHEEGATVGVVCTDKDAAMRIMKTATRMVSTSPELERRVQVYTERLVVPLTGSEMVVLPALVDAIEGNDFTLAVVDEIGFVLRPVWETTLLSLKRTGARALVLGTPPQPSKRDATPALDLVVEARLGLDPTLRLREFTSDPSHPSDCECCLLSANPGLGDILSRKVVDASRPPKVSDAEWQRARLGRWLEDGAETFVNAEAWRACAVPGPVPDRAEVVLSFDGSFSLDATVLTVTSIGPVPHVDLVGLWLPPEGADSSWRVDVVEVEDAIRAACRRWRVKEVCADPYRWNRSLQVLAAERLPVTEFPQTSARMSPATTAFREAVVNGQLTHSGNRDLAAHVGHAVLRDDARGVRITKVSRHSGRRIDAAVTAVMGFSRALHYANPSRGRSRALVLDHRRAS